MMINYLSYIGVPCASFVYISQLTSIQLTRGQGQLISVGRLVDYGIKNRKKSLIPLSPENSRQLVP